MGVSVPDPENPMIRCITGQEQWAAPGIFYESQCSHCLREARFSSDTECKTIPNTQPPEVMSSSSLADEDTWMIVKYGCENPPEDMDPESQCSASRDYSYRTESWVEKYFCDSTNCFDYVTDQPYIALFNASRGPVYTEVATEKSVEENAENSEGGAGDRAGCLGLILILTLTVAQDVYLP